jgi:hypothetical protein
MGFHCTIPNQDWNDKSKLIFFFEAYTILSALHWVAHLDPPPCHLVIFTDNQNTVGIFDSLWGSPQYNQILTTAIELMIQFNIQLCVYHIPGKMNHIADALS